MKIAHIIPFVCTGIIALAGCSDIFNQAEKTLIATAEADISGRLLDPDNSQFRNVRGSPQLRCVTGELLAKNRYGAFTGWQRFYWHENSGVMLGEDDPIAVTTAYLQCAVGFDLQNFLPMRTSADEQLAKKIKPVILEQIKDPKAALYNVVADASKNCVAGKYLLPGQKIELFAWKDGVSDFSEVKDEQGIKKYNECMNVAAASP